MIKILDKEQNSYLTEIVNVYIVQDLDARLKNPTNNFKFENCLLGATNMIKNSDKDSSGSWSFDNGFARKVVIFGVGNSSSYSDNRKSNFLILGEDPTYGINGSFG